MQSAATDLCCLLHAQQCGERLLLQASATGARHLASLAQTPELPSVQLEASFPKGCPIKPLRHVQPQQEPGAAPEDGMEDDPPLNFRAGPAQDYWFSR